MGSYSQALANSEKYSDMQRQQAIQQNQAASLGIAHILTSGIHPDTGAVLTPQEKIQLAQKNKELQAQLQDLWNPRQDVNTLGKNESAASGVAQPETAVHKVGDFLHITKPPVSTARQTTTADTPATTVGGQTIPGSAGPTVQGGAKSPQQQMQDLRDITQRYQPLPGQAEAESQQYQQRAKLQAIDADPNLTPEQKQEARSRAYGLSSVGNFKTVPITLADGRTISAQQDTKTGRWFDLNNQPIPPELLTGAKASGTETADTRARADFADFQKKNPDYKGSFQQWKTEQAGKGRNASKPETFDQQYQAILVKKAAGRPLSPDEKAREAAWQTWNREKNIEPGVARAAAFGASRYIPVIDPTDPEKVTMMRAGDAANAHVGTPASIAFQIDKALTKAFTSGKPADTINYFNTATEHLKLLKEASIALNNGDTQLFNSLANRFATATGSAAPTNFDTIRNAVAGELAKTFKGSGASDEEIALITATVNNTQSPDQLFGAIDSDLKLMGGKMDALRGQYEKGKQGKPNFSEKDPLGVL